MAVVREDVVKLSFDFDGKGMSEANDAMDDLIRNTQKLGGSDGAGKAEDGLDKAQKAAKKLGDTDLKTLASGLDSLATKAGQLALKIGATAVKGIAAGVATGAAAVAGLAGQAITSYAQYEQLVGGVETLFGAGGQSIDAYAKSVGKSRDEIKDEYTSLIRAQATVMRNADNAWQTAGLSANAYMETVTGFSASLLQSLDGDTQKAAAVADKALTDMADNANKMGTDMGSIQHAYQGFAKQNYTMLDNLKLGYGGTKEEMKRLLKDAEKLSGQKFDISSYADVIEAIHIIQEEMGIAGTTAKEASTTIQGSALAMKAAYSNFITGMANDNADMDALIDNLTKSARTFLDNLIPVIKRTLPRLSQGLTEIFSTVGAELPGIIADLAPALIAGGVQLVKSLFDAFVNAGPQFKKAGVQIIRALYEGLTGKRMKVDTLWKIEDAIDRVAESCGKIFAGLVDFGKNLMTALGPAVEWIGGALVVALEWLGDNINWVLPLLGSLLGALLAFKAVRGVTSAVSSVASAFKGLGGLFGGKAAGGALGGSGGSGGGSGGSGGGSGGGFFSSLASMKPTTVLKGMANLAIVVGGLALLGAALAAAAPYIAQLSDWKSLVEVVTIIAAVGVVGAGLAKLTGSVGNIQVSTVAKGLADIAICLAGFALLGTALAFVAPYIADLSTGGEFMEVIGIIAVTGVVGAALAGLSGLIGAIPISLVLTGLGNIALALGGFTAIVAAFAALKQIDGYTEFMASGGDALTQLAGILGSIGGALVGAFAETASDALPGIGENISGFITSLQPAFTALSDFDTSSIGDFAGSLAALIGVLTLDSLVNCITGGIDYAGLGTNLSDMATNLEGFFTAIDAIGEGSFEKAAKLFNCLAGIEGLPQEGGLLDWNGDHSTALKNIASVLPDVAADVSAFCSTMGDRTDFSAITALFNAFAAVSSLPQEGGILDWNGDQSTALKNISAALPDVASNIAGFYANIGDRTDFSAITNLFNAISAIDIDSDVASKGFLGLGSSQLETMGKGLSAFATNAKGFLDAINGLNLDNLTGLFDAISDMSSVSAGVESFSESMATAMNDAVTAVEAGMNAIAGMMPGFYASGVALMEGLNNGMQAMLPSLIATAQAAAAAIKSATDAALDINSPSRVMMESGYFAGQGMALGLKSTVPEIKLAANEMSMASIPYGSVSGYSPESSTSTYNSSESSTYTISPSFSVNISGTQDDRSMARKVKQYVAEAITETFESLDRKLAY